MTRELWWLIILVLLASILIGAAVAITALYYDAHTMSAAESVSVKYKGTPK